LQGHGQLGASLGIIGPQEIAWFRPHVGHQERLARTGHPAHHALLTDLDAQGRPIRILPVRANGSLDDQFAALDETDAHHIVAKGLVERLGDLLQQRLYVEDRGDVMAHLADDAKLLGPPLLRLDKTRVVQRDPDLLSDRGQQLHVALSKLAVAPGHGKQRAQHLALGMQGGDDQRV
jgi:hypothetical protein